MEARVEAHGLPGIGRAVPRSSRRWASRMRGSPSSRASSEAEVRARRIALGVRPVFKRIDTCAAEFASPTAYMYSTYERGLVLSETGEQEDAPVCEAEPSARDKVVILGGGPNRIGQGIEFDYCCCHAAFALSKAGTETIMVNCNPETVSTDYDTSDRLYFEPLTAEDVLEIIAVEQSKGRLKGVIVQFGGQTPLKLAEALEEAGVPILGTSPDAIDLAEDRDRFKALVDKLCAQAARERHRPHARGGAQRRRRLGYPVMIRPSYVLGGRAMEIVADGAEIDRYVARLSATLDQPSELVVSDRPPAARSTAILPTPSRSTSTASATARHLHRRHHGAHRGGGHSFRRQRLLAAGPFARVLDPGAAREADPRPGAGAQGRRPDERAVRGEGPRDLHPRGQPARLAHGAVRRQGDRQADRRHRRAHHERGAAGRLQSQDAASSPTSPSRRRCFRSRGSPASIPILGPEMRSTGEVMGIDRDFAMAFAKSQLGAGNILPRSGSVFVSVRDADKEGILGRHARSCRPRLPHPRHPRHAPGIGSPRHTLRAGQQGARRAPAHRRPA